MIKIIEEGNNLNPLESKDFNIMTKMNSVDEIKDYLYEITMSCNESEAKETLKRYLVNSMDEGLPKITNACIQILKGSFNVASLSDLFLN